MTLIERLKKDLWPSDDAVVIAKSGLLREAAAELEANAAEIGRLREALEIAVRIADSWIHDQLDGTRMLDDALAELEPARAALNKQESGND